MQYNLSFKYSLFSIILIVVFTSVFTIIFLNMQRNTFEEQIREEAVYYCKILESSTAENVVSYRLNRIRESIFFLKQNPLIRYAYVIGKDGKIISNGEYRSNILFNLPIDEFHLNAIKSDTILVQGSDSLVEASMPIKLGTEKLGFVRIGISKENIVKKISAFTNIAILLGFVFIITGSMLTYYVVKRISKPLELLTGLTHKISNGQFDTKINIKSSDELETLANAFNDMSDKLSVTRNSLIDAKNDAERSDKLKTEFLAQISHEIRTPINTLLNYTSLIKENLNMNENEEIGEYFKVINNAGKRITRTVDLTLNMSEIIRGNYQPQFESFDINNDLLKNLYVEFQSAASVKGLDLIFDPQDKHCLVYTDKYTATQIFQNLIDNAIKYTKEGFVEIKSICKSDAAVVSIIDSGEGISKEFQIDMFEPFRQEEQGYSRRYEGAGLGLSLVYKYCELTNAKINVKSEKGKGTAFNITLNSRS